MSGGSLCPPAASIFILTLCFSVLNWFILKVSESKHAVTQSSSWLHVFQTSGLLSPRWNSISFSFPADLNELMTSALRLIDYQTLFYRAALLQTCSSECFSKHRQTTINKNNNKNVHILIQTKWQKVFTRRTTWELSVPPSWLTLFSCRQFITNESIYCWILLSSCVHDIFW